MYEDFYQSPTLTLARNLLGKVLVRSRNGERLSGRIVEVEAYHQDGDQAAHSFSGRTQRNAVMFGPPGFLYVYFIYGMHFCMNVVSEEEGVGAAVLIRAIEPIEGVEEMRRLRGDRHKAIDLTNGPAKACAALAVNGEQNGFNLVKDSEIWLEDAPPPHAISTSTRIGITKSVSLPWRFFETGNPYVSKGKPS